MFLLYIENSAICVQLSSLDFLVFSYFLLWIFKPNFLCVSKIISTIFPCPFRVTVRVLMNELSVDGGYNSWRYSLRGFLQPPLVPSFWYKHSPSTLSFCTPGVCALCVLGETERARAITHTHTHTHTHTEIFSVQFVEMNVWCLTQFSQTHLHLFVISRFT